MQQAMQLKNDKTDVLRPDPGMAFVKMKQADRELFGNKRAEGSALDIARGQRGQPLTG